MALPQIGNGVIVLMPANRARLNPAFARIEAGLPKFCRKLLRIDLREVIMSVEKSYSMFIG